MMEQPAPPRPHIIVMEDEPVIRGLIVQSLLRRDYVVEEAPDGRAALALFRDRMEADPNHAILLILDLVVPNGMGGVETLEQARHLRAGVKAIIASGLSDEDELQRLEEPGRTAILQKPYDMNALLGAVASLTAVPDPGPTH